jgi:periplasmic divalent cation tolerance protein
MTTTPDKAEAEKLAGSIIEDKLAACVQILPQMTSVYFWEGKVQNETEHLLLIKTVEEKFDELSDFIQKNHSYDVPEIVAIEAERVSEEYLLWVRGVTNQNRER